jgi:predicted nucleotidyltransferase component of viral defense system
MLSLKEIENFYPENQKVFKKNILREYLQHKILQIIFNSGYASKISFMGGTCIRIVHNSGRFSEDLDFDNFNLTFDDFIKFAAVVKDALELEGYIVEIKNVHKKAFRCYIRLPKVLFDQGLSGYEEEKILIQLDSESQQIDYKPDSFILNKFDIFTQIFVTPADILLSQKIWAILNRKIIKGRDLYDASKLFGFAKPDYAYLDKRASIKNLAALKERINERLSTVDIELIANEVKPFLINPSETSRVLNFNEYVKKLK